MKITNSVVVIDFLFIRKKKVAIPIIKNNDKGKLEKVCPIFADSGISFGEKIM